MDNLDQLLLEAWNRISDRLRTKRISALKRSRRRFKGVLTRPMREWCLVIRASDTRIDRFNAIIEPVWETLGVPAGRCDPLASHEPHTITIDGRLIRRLTAPVSIPWPGVTYHEAARICGRPWKTMKGWARSGQFKIDFYREFRFPEFTRRSRGYEHMGPDEGECSGGGRPYVWTPSPIDVNNFIGRTPHAVWGTLWQWMWEQLPENYLLTVRREPEGRMFRGDWRFRGWSWICPGRANAEGEIIPCGRRCRYLYGPQTVWTMARMMGMEEGFDMPEQSGLAGQWHPGMGDPIQSKGPRSFACKTCWGVRSACMANDGGWNEFIAQVSGGLLYGRDVPRPTDICPVMRRKRPYKWKRRRGSGTAAAGGRGRLMRFSA